MTKTIATENERGHPPAHHALSRGAGGKRQISREGLRRHCRRGTSPTPIRTSARAVGWLASEIYEWQQALIAERDARFAAKIKAKAEADEADAAEKTPAPPIPQSRSNGSRSSWSADREAPAPSGSRGATAIKGKQAA